MGNKVDARQPAKATPVKIRIDEDHILPNTDLTAIIESLTETELHKKTTIIVKETEPRNHYHIYVESHLTEKTIRKRLDTILDDTGNRAKSVSRNHNDWKGYQGYMFKYPTTECVFLGSSHDISDLQSYYKKVSTKRHGDTENIILQLDAHLHETYGLRLDFMLTPKRLAEIIIEWYISKNKLIRKAYLAEMVETMYVRHRPGAAKVLAIDIVGMTSLKDIAYKIAMIEYKENPHLHPPPEHHPVREPTTADELLPPPKHDPTIGDP